MISHRLRTAGRPIALGGLVAAAALGLGCPAWSLAFQGNATAGRKSDTADQEVVIKREAVKLTDPKTYKASMHLQPMRSVSLIAPVDGYVRAVSIKPQQKLGQQAEAFRFDNRQGELLLKKARAQLQAAHLEKKIAQAKGDADQVALADARLEAAQADVDLAQMEVERLIVRAPFAGEVERVFAAEGQFVRAGERLATFIDASRLVVEVPVERSAASPGGTVEIKVEDIPVKAKVEAVIALGDQFDSLRELTVSPASAIVAVDNGGGKLSAGQTVYSDLIPLAPVTVVPSIAINNASDGLRKVQVLRENIVRDLTVRVLSKVGTDSVFVSGRFTEGDEVIVSSTRTLADGTPLRALAGGGATKASSPRPDSAPATGTAKPAF